MIRKILLLCALFGLLSATGIAATFEGLPEAVDAARQVSLTPPVNPATCHSVAQELVRLAGVYSTSSYVPEALTRAAQLEHAAGNAAAALDLATRVVKNYSASSSTPAAFELAFALLTHDGKDSMAGVELARSLAVSLGSNANAGYYYETAFNACRDSQHWREALAIGEQYLKSCTETTPAPRFVLALGDVALLAADTPLAMQWLEGYLDRYPKLPQTVAVRAKLGQLYAAAGNRTKANECYSLAWTSYQRNASRPDYQQPEIASASANALWELQTDARAEFDGLTAVSGELDKSRVERRLESLAAAYTEIMKTDGSAAPRALNAIGDVHARYADALLKQGFQVALNSMAQNAPVPYVAASPEYRKAVAFHLQAREQAAGQNADAEARRQSAYAASRAFELTSGEGDAVFAWAIHLYETAPNANVGEHGNQDRIACLTKEVLPRFEAGLARKTDALAMAKTLDVPKQAREVRQTLDMAVRPVLGDLAQLTSGEVHRIETASTQLASSFKAGFQPASTKTLAQSLEENFAYATKLSTTMQETLGRFYQLFEQNSLPEPSLAFWTGMVADASYNYAAACRTMQDDLAACVGQISVKRDDDNLALYNRLTKLQAQGAEEEFAGLVKWHDFATQHNIQDATSSKLEARLAQIDPTHYGTSGGINSASRKKP